MTASMSSESAALARRVLSTAATPGWPKAASLAARRGSSAASMRSISSRMRCSSMGSAMGHLRRPPARPHTLGWTSPYYPPLEDILPAHHLRLIATIPMAKYRTCVLPRPTDRRPGLGALAAPRWLEQVCELFETLFYDG